MLQNHHFSCSINSIVYLFRGCILGIWGEIASIFVANLMVSKLSYSWMHWGVEMHQPCQTYPPSTKKAMMKQIPEQLWQATDSTLAAWRWYPTWYGFCWLIGQGSLKCHPLHFWGESNLIPKFMGIFEGFSEHHSACLGWCHTMSLVGWKGNKSELKPEAGRHLPYRRLDRDLWICRSAMLVNAE